MLGISFLTSAIASAANRVVSLFKKGEQVKCIETKTPKTQGKTTKTAAIFTGSAIAATGVFFTNVQVTPQVATSTASNASISISFTSQGEIAQFNPDKVYIMEVKDSVIPNLPGLKVSFGGADASAAWRPYTQVWIANYPEGNGRDFWQNVGVCQYKAKNAGYAWWTATYRDGSCWARGWNF